MPTSPRSDSQVFVQRAPDVSTAAALAAPRYRAGALRHRRVGPAAYKAERAKPIQQMLMLVDALLALANLIVLPGIGNTRPRSAIREPSLQGDDHGLPADRGAELLAGHAYRARHAQFAGALEDR
jgi:hypothetical protein